MEQLLGVFSPLREDPEDLRESWIGQVVLGSPLTSCWSGWHALRCGGHPHQLGGGAMRALWVAVSRREGLSQELSAQPQGRQSVSPPQLTHT